MNKKAKRVLQEAARTALIVMGAMATFGCARNVQNEASYRREETVSFEESYFEKFVDSGYINMDEVPEERGVNGRSVKLNTDEIEEILFCLQSAKLQNDIELDYNARCDYILWLYDHDKVWLGCLEVVDGYVDCDGIGVGSEELEKLISQLAEKYFPKE